MRCVLAGISYKVPKKLYGELVAAVVYNQNDIPQAAHPTTTPRSLFEGRKLELTKRIMIPFGTLVTMKVVDKKNPANKMEPRIEVGIALGPSMSTYGAIRCYAWESGRIHTRDKIDILKHLPDPFPYKIEKYKATADPMFKEAGRAITHGNFPTNERQYKEANSTDLQRPSPTEKDAKGAEPKAFIPLEKESDSLDEHIPYEVSEDSGYSVNSEPDYLEELYEEESQTQNFENEAPSDQPMNLHMSATGDWSSETGKSS